jgi:NADP-dependent 3-hydroxy acid dehydrogenase YdfG
MKLAITGHTKGIGKALKELIEQHGHEVIGFSSTTGYDISSESDRIRILDRVKDFDVFVNNAYTPQGQTLLLKSMIDLWQGSSNTIININSKATMMPAPPPLMEEYVKDKLEQKSIIASKFFKGSPHIINVTLGLVDTDMAKVFDAKKMKPEDVAKLIWHLISIRDSVAVQDILLEVPGLDWNDISQR